ncbi:hypothetical protein HMPREF0860_0605 [Treponema socranskii subsp. socranskii VPI DR56BR1116 = ATCC 35536]|uniref:Uncharacterized protein n=1 Tax=Treponema socranskii subsp. socranskii VPI DR56BR1116 = ATCC 35536 TaxID=1125725 RepID=A0ABP2YPH3_TRESO|nr:hypothetical protein HMPREF0860_0605 [Treponema socranskii subsp. socranskii VPI DR56BR1116 = ATCC 35536]
MSGNIHAENARVGAEPAKSGGITKRHTDTVKTTFRRRFTGISISLHYENLSIYDTIKLII